MAPVSTPAPASLCAHSSVQAAVNPLAHVSHSPCPLAQCTSRTARLLLSIDTKAALTPAPACTHACIHTDTLTHKHTIPLSICLSWLVSQVARTQNPVSPLWLHLEAGRGKGWVVHTLRRAACSAAQGAPLCPSGFRRDHPRRSALEDGGPGRRGLSCHVVAEQPQTQMPLQGTQERAPWGGQKQFLKLPASWGHTPPGHFPIEKGVFVPTLSREERERNLGWGGAGCWQLRKKTERGIKEGV